MNQMEEFKEEYCCVPCGVQFLTPQQIKRGGSPTTFHEGKCCVCCEVTNVTSTRRYNYLKKHINNEAFFEFGNVFNVNYRCMKLIVEYFNMNSIPYKKKKDSSSDEPRFNIVPELFNTEIEKKIWAIIENN